MDEEMSLRLQIERAIEKTKSEGGTREMALVTTKLQEALLWLGEHQKVLDSKTRQMGFKGPTA